MKKRNLVIALIVFLTIGFASIATNLIVNGTLNVGYNEENFGSSVVYTYANTETGVKAEINNNEKNIDFETERIENVNQTSILEFDVTNKSKQYDANVIITCGLKDEYKSFSEYIDVSLDLTSPFSLASGSTKTGFVTVKMTKAYNESLNETIKFNCELVASPVERTSVGEEYVPRFEGEKILNGADPVISGDLIPVTLSDSGEVTYAALKEEWYSYENKRWANAVILVDNPSKEYKEGNIIKESDIEAYFVWIPRYRYKIFDEGNYDTAVEEIPTESNAKEIEIEFESKDTVPSTGSTKNSWLTHPAFTNFDVNGIWVGKFETGYNGATTTAEAEVNATDETKVIIKPNTYSWRNNTVSNMFKTAYNYNRELDSHMMKNTEWGAAAYLSHSKYGINTEVNINNNSDYLTGYSAVEGTDQSSYHGTSGSDESVTLPYNTSTGYKATTTGNITGIYDMSGGSWEYVAAYMPSASDKSGFTSAELTQHSKYLDQYPSNSKVKSWNNRILGDAIGEMGPFYYYADKDNTKRYHSNWYGDFPGFVDSAYPWFGRGGYYMDGILAGQFEFSRSAGAAGSGDGSRLVLAPQA